MLTEAHLVSHGVPQAVAQTLSAQKLTPQQWLQIIQAILAGLGPIFGNLPQPKP